MTDQEFPQPKLNHVAVTVPRDLLDAEHREQIARFYREVFNWHEIPQMTEDRNLLILTIGGFSEFVFLLGKDEPARFTETEHFGVQTETLEQFDEIRGRIEAQRDQDDRVVLEAEEPQDFGPLVLHSYYVRYLLPVKIEVQHYVTKSRPVQPAVPAP